MLAFSLVRTRKVPRIEEMMPSAMMPSGRTNGVALYPSSSVPALNAACSPAVARPTTATDASVDVHNPKVVRSTAGSLFHLPVVTGLSLEGAVSALRSAGLAILAADGAGDQDLDDLLDVAGPGARDRDPGVPDLSHATAWVFGNEAWGLPEQDRALADAVVRVPIRGRAESLNLATAATVCLYASARAQR